MNSRQRRVDKRNRVNFWCAMTHRIHVELSLDDMSLLRAWWNDPTMVTNLATSPKHHDMKKWLDNRVGKQLKDWHWRLAGDGLDIGVLSRHKTKLAMFKMTFG